MQIKRKGLRSILYLLRLKKMHDVIFLNNNNYLK